MPVDTKFFFPPAMRKIYIKPMKRCRSFPSCHSAAICDRASLSMRPRQVPGQGLSENGREGGGNLTPHCSHPITTSSRGALRGFQRASWPRGRWRRKGGNGDPSEGPPFWTRVLVGIEHLESRTRWCASHHHHHNHAHWPPSPPLPSLPSFPSLPPPSGEPWESCAFPQSRGTCPGFFPT